MLKESCTFLGGFRRFPLVKDSRRQAAETSIKCASEGVSALSATLFEMLAMGSCHCWGRATPIARLRSRQEEDRAIGVARSQQRYLPQIEVKVKDRKFD